MLLLYAEINKSGKVNAKSPIPKAGQLRPPCLTAEQVSFKECYGGRFFEVKGPGDGAPMRRGKRHLSYNFLTLNN